ncbi:MAG: glycosyltransferase [Alphaproteobacteria bacterium]|nr:glycosyltransferase [Alphaproteobacteria bacterium]
MLNKTILIYKKSNLIAGAGGIEKLISWFSGALTGKGYRVFVATRDRKQGQLFYPLDKRVTFHHFRIHFSRIRRILGQIGLDFVPYFNRELYIAKEIRAYCNEIKPDVIICEGIQDLADIVYHDPYPCTKIVQLHSEPSIFFTKKKKELFERTLKQADIVQVLLPSFIPTLKRYYQGKIVAIGNPVPENNQPKHHKPIIIYPARIDKDKQQHLLIEAFAKITQEFSHWQVHFYGASKDTDYQKQCTALVQKYHLKNQIKFMGLTNEIPDKMAEASIIAFPSRFEGFGLALAEGMAAGLPAIGFKNASAVSDLIKDKVNGFLVTDIDDFAERLGRLMEDEKLRQKMGHSAQESMKQYLPEKILNQWLDVIEN